MLPVALLAACAPCVADDVSDTPSSAEERSVGVVTRTIETVADRDLFRVAVLPYVTNVITVSTGTIWDCEVELLTPSGTSSIFFTNTAAGAAAPVIVVSTTVAYRAYIEVRSLAEYTTGTYQFGWSTSFGDTDGDGLPDAWETARFGTLTNGPAGDPDGDGASNQAEYMTGTDPGSASSALAISGLTISGSTARVTWQSVPQGLYRVSEAAGPAGGWSVLADGVLATSTVSAVTDGTSTGLTAYRVELRY